MKKSPVLNPKHLTALRYAVRQAEAWRGNYVGNDGSYNSREHEAVRLSTFDANIAAMKTALKAVSAAIKTRVSNQRIAKRNAQGWPFEGPRK